MDELRKIKRVLGKQDESAPHEVLLVLDGTIGQNALSQAREFGEAMGVTGLVLTKLDGAARLAQADACSFDPEALFGEAEFDHIVFSYSLSMIPDWQAALDEAMRHLAPGGTLHVVDFGDQGRLPGWFKTGLRAWLARFHVAPRDTLGAAMQDMAAGAGTLTGHSLYRGYAIYGCLTR